MTNDVVFLVEDDLHIQQLVQYNLENSGYIVSVFDNARQLLNECQSTLPDIFILDIMLPGMDGLEICKTLRTTSATANIPIIFLSAKSDELEKILGLELGADDYISKPFSVRELIARIKAVLRRSNKSEDNNCEVISYADLTLDITRHEVKKKGVEIEVSPKEFELLKILLLNKGKVLSRELLLEKVWGYECSGETRTVDVHVRYLRSKIEDKNSSPNYIETVRGIGYRFNNKL